MILTPSTAVCKMLTSWENWSVPWDRLALFLTNSLSITNAYSACFVLFTYKSFSYSVELSLEVVLGLFCISGD